MITINTVNTKKLEVQPKVVVNQLPMDGASIGEALNTRMRKEKIFAFSSGGKISLTMAVAVMVAEHAPIAWTNRKIIKV